jgi:predicted secreted protein
MSFVTANFVGVGQTISYSGTPLLHTTDVTYGANKVDTADNTDSQSAGSYRTFLPALKDAGDCTIKGVWYPGETSQEGLETIKGTIVQWVHTLPNSLGTITFQGMITGVDHTAPLDKAADYTVKVKISGPSVYAHS